MNAKLDCPLCHVHLKGEGGKGTGIGGAHRWWICPFCHGMFSLPYHAYNAQEKTWVRKQLRTHTPVK